jgi:hypothetical protein
MRERQKLIERAQDMYPQFKVCMLDAFCFFRAYLSKYIAPCRL